MVEPVKSDLVSIQEMTVKWVDEVYIKLGRSIQPDLEAGIGYISAVARWHIWIQNGLAKLHSCLH
jgi:hypothetical protein